METPLVMEQPRPLEPVGPDPFIDGIGVVSAHGAGGGVSLRGRGLRASPASLDQGGVLGLVEEEARGVQHLAIAQAL
jgi:hypothetical protein